MCPESILAIYKCYELGLVLGAFSRKSRCGVSEFCHCDQTLVNNLTEQGTGVQRAQSFKAGSIDSGPVVRQGFVAEGVFDRGYSAYCRWGAEKAYRKRFWQDKVSKAILSPLTHSLQLVPLLISMSPH